MASMPYRSVLCAVDLDDPVSSVLYHAVGLAVAAGARLTIVAAVKAGADVPDAEARLERLFAQTAPYDATPMLEPEVCATPGSPLDVILQVADARDAGLIVAGTHARGGLARLLLGSTSHELLQRTHRPLLLVPPTDLDIVTLVGTGVGLHFGAVLVAVDLAEHNPDQLRMASRMAALARQPLVAMTVAAADGPADHHVASALRSAVSGLEPVGAGAFIVRRGNPAQEIARGALAEQAGLVVMGLKREHRGKPGGTATAVLQSGRALVLAVPET